MFAATRARALAEPHRYLLLFGAPTPGYEAPAETREAASRIFRALFAGG